MLFKLELFFHDELYWCVRDPNVEYQVEILDFLFIKSDAQKQMFEFDFGHRFHDLENFEVGIFLYSLNSLSTCSHHHKLCRKSTI